MFEQVILLYNIYNTDGLLTSNSIFRQDPFCDRTINVVKFSLNLPSVCIYMPCCMHKCILNIKQKPCLFKI